MNWQKYYETFDDVDIADVSLFATPREIKEAVEAYNKALTKLKKDKNNSKQALRSIEAIANDYPMFPQAMHIRAIAKADAGELQEALDLFKKIRLLDIDEKQAALLKEQIFIAEKELAHLKAQNKAGIKGKNKVKDTKKVSVTDILVKAPKSKKKHHLNREEINELNRQLGNENPLDLSGEIAYEDKKANRRFTGIVILVAVLTVSIFYYGIRPAILKATGNNVQYMNQLHWLEKEISKRSEDDAGIKKLLNDYYAAFQTEEQNSEAVDSTGSSESTNDLSNNTTGTAENTESSIFISE